MRTLEGLHFWRGRPSGLVTTEWYDVCRVGIHAYKASLGRTPREIDTLVGYKGDEEAFAKARLNSSGLSRVAVAVALDRSFSPNPIVGHARAGQVGKWHRRNRSAYNATLQELVVGPGIGRAGVGTALAHLALANQRPNIPVTVDVLAESPEVRKMLTDSPFVEIGSSSSECFGDEAAISARTIRYLAPSVQGVRDYIESLPGADEALPYVYKTLQEPKVV